MWFIKKEIKQINENGQPAYKRLDPEFDSWIGFDGRQDEFSEDVIEDWTEEQRENLKSIKENTTIMIIQQNKNNPEDRIISLGKFEKLEINITSFRWIRIRFKYDSCRILDYYGVRENKKNSFREFGDELFYLNENTKEILVLEGEEDYNELKTFLENCELDEFYNFREYIYE